MGRARTGDRRATHGLVPCVLVLLALVGCGGGGGDDGNPAPHAPEPPAPSPEEPPTPPAEPPPAEEPPPPLPPATGAATLTWNPPTRNTNGSSLTNLAGFRIRYGLSADELDSLIELTNPGLTAYTIESLTPATWHFAVKAYTSGGAESALSNIVSKTIR